jgi:DNA-binding response OmpR family regulator
VRAVSAPGTPRYAVCMVGADAVLLERIRASLRGSPFDFLPADPPHRHVDLYIAPASAAPDLVEKSAPVIAWGAAAEMRAAFLAGCEDFLRDPWTPQELGLRALAAIARSARRFRFAWGELSFSGQDLCTPGGLAALTFHESVILMKLLRARGQPVPREALAYAITGAPQRAPSRAIDVHVASVRRKVRGLVPAAGRFILSVRGQGYMVP